MFTPSVLKTISKIIGFLEKTYIFPFTWNHKVDTLSISTSRIVPIVSAIAILHYIPYMLHLLHQLYRHFYSGLEIKVMDMFWIVLMVKGYVICLEAVVATHIKRSVQVAFFNRMKRFDAVLGSLVVTKHKTKRERGHEKVALLLCRGSSLGAFLLAVMANLVYTIKPRAPQYVYSAYSEPDDRVAYVLFYLMEVLTKSMNIVAFFLSQTWFLFSVAFLTSGLATVRKCGGNLETKIFLYRSLYMLNYHHNECYFSTMIPFRLIFFGFQIVTGIVVLVRLDSVITTTEKIMVSYMLLVFIISPFLFLHISGTVLKSSRLLKSSLRSGTEQVLGGGRRRKLLRRMVRSLRPFGVTVGAIRAVSYTALNQFFLTIISVLTTALVASRR